MKVIYETFDLNEAMLTKIEQGGTAYDIAIPSEYTIEKMRKQNLLYPIDHAKLPNLRYIDDRFMDLPFDPGNQYAIPYLGGRSVSYTIQTKSKAASPPGTTYGILNFTAKF